MSASPVGIHLVGSMPLPTVTDTFTKISSSIPHHIRRLPDGEPGERSIWIMWQNRFFKPLVPPPTPSGPPVPDQLPPKSPFTYADYGPDVESMPDASLPPIGYDEVALSSWSTFKDLRAKGVIPAGVKFLVALPTPLAVVAGWIMPSEQVKVEKVYERQMRAAVRRIQDAIPAADLAIQWDCAFEFAMIERVWPTWVEEPLTEGLLDRIARAASWVDESVELGFHLCYGDLGHVHFVEPKDMGLLVEVANGIRERVGRKIDWIHMPVPKSRDDVAYFEPLKGLKAGEETTLYLGLVHSGDEEGTKRRIETAKSVLDGRSFGIGTECGIGRTPPDELDDILAISKAVSLPCKS